MCASDVLFRLAQIGQPMSDAGAHAVVETAWSAPSWAWSETPGNDHAASGGSPSFSSSSSDGGRSVMPRRAQSSLYCCTAVTTMSKSRHLICLPSAVAATTLPSASVNIIKHDGIGIGRLAHAPLIGAGL